jgi:hypothetical protein
MSLLKSETRTIGAYEVTVKTLNTRDARAVYPRIQRILVGFADAGRTVPVNAFVGAGLAGLISEDDLTFYIDKFGPATTVDMGVDAQGNASRISLAVQKGRNGERDEGAIDRVFGGDFALLLEWLDFAVRVTFEGLIAKINAVMQPDEGGPAAKAQPTE